MSLDRWKTVSLLLHYHWCNCAFCRFTDDCVLFVAAVCLQWPFDTTLLYRWKHFAGKAPSLVIEVDFTCLMSLTFVLINEFRYEALNACCRSSAVPLRLVGFSDFAYCTGHILMLDSMNAIVCILIGIVFLNINEITVVDKYKSVGKY